jgi:hypothetical protein
MRARKESHMSKDIRMAGIWKTYSEERDGCMEGMDIYDSHDQARINQYAWDELCAWFANDTGRNEIEKDEQAQIQEVKDHARAKHDEQITAEMIAWAIEGAEMIGMLFSEI